MFKYVLTALVLGGSLLATVAPASANHLNKKDCHCKAKTTSSKQVYTKAKQNGYGDDRYNDKIKNDQTKPLPQQDKLKEQKTSFPTKPVEVPKVEKPKVYRPHNGYDNTQIIIIPKVQLPVVPVVTTPPFNPDPNASYDLKDREDNYKGKNKGKNRKYKHHHKDDKGRQDEIKSDNYDDDYPTDSRKGNYSDESYGGKKSGMSQREYQGYQKPYPFYGNDKMKKDQYPNPSIDQKIKEKYPKYSGHKSPAEGKKNSKKPCKK
jgi:hypothetical protein